jgi:hypothetical protein
LPRRIKLAKQQAEAIAEQERLAKEQAEQRQAELEELLQQYRDRFGDVSE